MKDMLQNIPINILLADDDMDDRFFFDKALQEIPVATIFKTVSNGEQLMEYLFEKVTDLPDVLFLDLSMPRKTGYECLVEIKENESLKTLPVIMFTTSFTHSIDFEDNLKKTLSQMGAQDYIRKIGGFEELKSVIHQTLTKLIEQGTYKKNDNT